MGKKIKQYFDAPGFDKFSRGLERTQGRLREAVAILRSEGLDVSVKELSTYPKRFDDFNTGEGWKYRRHFDNLYNENVKRSGWLPNEEKNRMYQSYIDVAKRTHAAAQNITGIFDCGYKFKDTPEGAVIDIEATEEARRSDFIYDVDADAMAEHWERLNELRDKVKEFNQFNQKHGIPGIKAPGMYDFGGFAGYILNTHDINGDPIEVTQEQHDKSTWEFFKIKK